MLSLQRYIFLLVVWIAFFFNIERLHVNRNALINITLPTYIIVTAVIILGLMLPRWYRFSAIFVYGVAILSFVVTKLLYDRPYWGDAYTYLTLFEFASILVTAVLAHRVGQLIADFGETVRALLLTGVDKRVHPQEQAEIIAKQEMLSARRRNYSLSMLLIEADTASAKIKPSTTAHEIQQLLTRRMGLVTLTRLLATNLRTSDSIVDGSEQGRWLLMTAELDRTRASMILDRLNAQSTKGLGIRLKFGIASYPEQGLTFEDLLVRAEQDLKSEHKISSSEGVIDSAPILTPDPNVRFAPRESRLD